MRPAVLFFETARLRYNTLEHMDELGKEQILTHKCLFEEILASLWATEERLGGQERASPTFLLELQELDVSPESR